MDYRKLKRAGLSISALGLGCEHLVNHSYEDIEAIVRTAIDGGINLFDVFMAEPHVRDHLGKAIGSRRPDILLQGHLGAVMDLDQPTQSRDFPTVQRFFRDFLRRYNTDYCDIGYLHFIDTEADYDTVFNGPVLEYALRLKDEGVLRAIGLSTHSPAIALKAVQSGHLDTLMFPVNPAFDWVDEADRMESRAWQENPAQYGTDLTRQSVYTACKALNVGLVAMKPLGGGVLLDAERSPLGTALTIAQSVRYVLDNPAVVCAMVGCASVAEVEALLATATTPDSEQEYLQTLAKSSGRSMEGTCVYCNHCLPCPANIDIANVMQCFDLAKSDRRESRGVANRRYFSFERRASDCIECGRCELKCPFGVPVIARFKHAAELFGS